MIKSPLSVAGIVFLVCTVIASEVSFALGAIICIVSALAFLIMLMFTGKVKTDAFKCSIIIVGTVAFAVINMTTRSYISDLRTKDIPKETTQICGVVCNIPEIAYDKYVYIVDEDRYGKMKLTLTEEVDIGVYDRIRADVVFYDYSDKKSGIFSAAYVAGNIKKIASRDKDINYYLLKMKESAERFIDKTLTDTAPIVKGIVLGEKSSITEETELAFSRAGLSHILVFSGIHFSTVTMLVVFLLRKCRIKRRVSNVIQIFSIMFIMSIIGFTPSVLRAGISALVVVLCDFYLRDPDSVTTLSFSAIVTGIINPFAVTSVSFMLSFYSSLGIVMFYPRVRLYILEKYNLRNKMLKTVVETLIVTVCAQLAVFPLSAVYFDTISLAGFVSYLLIFSAVNILIISAVIAIVFSFSIVLAPVGSVLFYVSGAMAKYVMLVAEFVSKFSFSNVPLDALTIVVVLAVTVIVYCAVIGHFRHKNILKPAAFLCAILILFSSTLIEEINKDTVSVCQVAEDCCVVCSDDAVVIIGGAENSYEKTKVVRFLNFVGKNRVDLFIPFSQDKADYTYKMFKPANIMSSFENNRYYKDSCIYDCIFLECNQMKFKLTSSGVLMTYGKTQIAVVDGQSNANDFGKCDIYFGTALEEISNKTNIFCYADEQRVQQLALLNDNVYNNFTDSYYCQAGRDRFFTVRRY